MTLEQFNNLKVKDRVYLKQQDGKYLNTEVLKIDRYFKKLTVLLGRRAYSYKYIQKEVPVGKQSRWMVGMCDPIDFNLKRKKKSVFWR